MRVDYTYVHMGLIVAFAALFFGATWYIEEVKATQINEGVNNPYATDNPNYIDRERPTLTWCPDGPWEISEPTTLYLSMHDNSRFNYITYTIDGNEYDLLGNSQSTVHLSLGYHEGALYAEDVHGNSEDRYGYAINFTEPTTLKIVMYYQADQRSTYDCAGITNSWFLQPAYASDLTQFHTMTIQAGNATEQLTAAQAELEKLRLELSILEKQLALKAPDTTPYDQDDIDAALASLQEEHDEETQQIMTAVNQTLGLVNDVKTDVNRIIALCRQ